jgi:hypothetical protein
VPLNGTATTMKALCVCVCVCVCVCARARAHASEVKRNAVSSLAASRTNNAGQILGELRDKERPPGT